MVHVIKLNQIKPIYSKIKIIEFLGRYNFHSILSLLFLIYKKKDINLICLVSIAKCWFIFKPPPQTKNKDTDNKLFLLRLNYWNFNKIR